MIKDTLLYRNPIGISQNVDEMIVSIQPILKGERQ